MSESDVGPTVGHDVNNVITQPLSKQGMACFDALMKSNKLRGLYLPGFIGGARAMWLIETRAVRSILAFNIYNFSNVKFSLRSANSAISIALANA